VFCLELLLAGLSLKKGVNLWQVLSAQTNAFRMPQHHGTRATQLFVRRLLFVNFQERVCGIEAWPSIYSPYA